MSEPRSPETPRTPSARDDDALVRRIAEHYAAPPMSGRDRAAFQERLDARLRRRRRRLAPLLPLLTAAGVAAGAAWLALRTPAPDPAALAPTGRTAPREATAPVARRDAASAEAILALASEEPSDLDEALPEDYVAIASLFLEEI